MQWYKGFKLQGDPFDVGIQRHEDILLTRDFVRAQESIAEAILFLQMLFISGPRGAGKSIALREIIETAPADVLFVKDFALNIEKLTINHLREALIRALLQAQGGQEPLGTSEVSRTAQLRRLLGVYPGHVVLVLEDGHRMKASTLVNLKLLREMGFGMRERLLTVIILTQPSIKELLGRWDEVAKRATVIEMQGLSTKEVLKYIALKIETAGGKSDKLFEKDALAVIAKRLKFPLDINYGCSQLLRDAAEAGYDKVTKDFVQERLQIQSDLYTQYMKTGFSEHSVRAQMATLGVKRSSFEVHRLILGFNEDDTDGIGAIRKVLSPHIPDGIYIKDPRHQKVLQRIGHINHEREERNVDLSVMARDAGITLEQLFNVLNGKDTTEYRIKALEKFLKAA